MATFGYAGAIVQAGLKGFFGDAVECRFPLGVAPVLIGGEVFEVDASMAAGLENVIESIEEIGTNSNRRFVAGFEGGALDVHAGQEEYAGGEEDD